MSDSGPASQLPARPSLEQLKKQAKELLLERLGADRSLVSLRGGRGTLLHAAAESGQEATAKILMLFGGDRTATDAEGRTPADVAAVEGHTALAELLR